MNALHNPKNAVALIRAMEPIAASAGWHTALTGSVLYKGESNNDTDIILYPHDPADESDHWELLSLFEPIGLTVQFKTARSYVNREVYKCRFQDRNIDVFFFNEQIRQD